MYRKTAWMGWLAAALCAASMGAWGQTPSQTMKMEAVQATAPPPAKPAVPGAAEVAALKQKATAGDLASQKSLGEIYALGRGVPRSMSDAAKWFLKAAEQGDVPSQLKIGLMYMAGFGVAANPPQGIAWYKKAADQGNVDAMLRLANLYETGQQVPVSGRESLDWYTKAAQAGSVEAELRLGYVYRDGLANIQHDYQEALTWFRKAALHGSGEAEFNVGYMYQQGLGVVASVDQAADWYSKAAQDGYSAASAALRHLQR